MSRTSDNKCAELYQRYEKGERNGVYCERENFSMKRECRERGFFERERISGENVSKATKQAPFYLHPFLSINFLSTTLYMSLTAINLGPCC